MRRLLLAALMLWSAFASAAPPVPVVLMTYTNTQFTITNIVSVYQNVAVKTPAVDFQNVIIYGGAKAIDSANMLSWDLNPEPDVAGYFITFAKLTGPNTNAVTYSVLPTVNRVLFYNYFDTNYMYWFYCQATNTAGQVSLPSNVVMTQPR